MKVTLFIIFHIKLEVSQTLFRSTCESITLSDLAIETALTLRLLFKGPLRQTEGFLKSIFRLMNVGLNVPDHTTLSRRNSTLKTKLKRIGNPRGKVDLVIDSTA